MRKFLLLAAGMALGASFATAGIITYHCDSTLTSNGTCAVLNSTIADLYSSTFTDANASIYIQSGSTGLASTLQYYTNVTYQQYVNALTANEGDANDAIAVASLGGNTTNPVVAGDGVALTSALAEALGLTSVADSVGINISDGNCTLGTSGCYNAIITVSNAANTWYYRTGEQGAGTYDIYSAIEHETDEVLGTASCLVGSGNNASTITTSVNCENGNNVFNNGEPNIAVSAADLFRYASTGVRSYLNSADGTTAYFSIDCGVTDIANYNNSPNGGDYGDWDSAALRIQNAYATPGVCCFDITNDGGSEIAVLDAVGYNLVAPEPGSFLLLGTGVLALFARRKLRA